MKKVLLITIFSFTILYSYTQNVGIGVIDPNRAKLEVATVPGTTAGIFGTGAGISLQSNWPTIGFNQYRDATTGYGRYINGGYAAIQYLDPATGFMGIDMIGPGNPNELIPTAPKRAITIAQNGNVGIGTGSSNATLTVIKNIATGSTAGFLGTTHHSFFNYGNEEHTYIRAGKDGGTVFINDIPNSKIILTGFVGINTSTPNFPLEIRQTSDAKGLLLVNPNDFQNWEFDIGGANGHLYLSHNQSFSGTFGPDGTYTSASDRRLKKNIRPLASVLDKVMNLKPSEYDMIKQDSSGKKKIGFIAQEVNEYFPELVTVLANASFDNKEISNLHTLNYSGFGIIAIKAIQEQQSLIQKQGEKIDELGAVLDELTKKISVLTDNGNKQADIVNTKSIQSAVK